MSAQRKDKQKSAQIVRTISKLAGTLAGTTVDIGKRAPVFRAFVKAKTLVAALESELDAANHELATLESELDTANRKLDRTREKQSQLSSQLKAFQAENESLNFALKQAQNKTRGTKIKGSKMSMRVATLESELDTANRKLDKIREKTKKEQSQLSSQLKAFQAENESLNFALKQARNKTRGAKIKATKMNERVAILETALATTNGKLTEAQEKIKKTQSQLVSQIKTLQAKNESLNFALKQAQNKTRRAKIKEGKMSEHIATLETKLTTADHKSVVTQEKAEKTESRLSSQLKAFRAENKSLNSALKQSQDKARGIKAKATRASGRAATLETELTAANSKLAETQEKVEKTQSQLSAQLEVLQEKNKSAAVAKKTDAVKAEADQLIQQICDSSSFPAHGEC